MQNTASKTPTLMRFMGLWTLTLYGVGDMLGAGIYGLVGKAAGQMGNAVWLAFACSMVAALLTGLSYASLGSRYPRAAGAAYVVHRAFGKTFLSYVLGLAVMASGLTSMATASKVFAGYFFGLGVPVAVPVIVIGFILALTFINYWGIRESIWLNIICTLVEAGGLLLVMAVGMRYWGSVNLLETPMTPEGPVGLGPQMVLQGAVLTFFSFIGFEDMLNVTEEVKDPETVFPKAVVLALVFTTVLYMAISITAVSVIPYAELAKSKQPLVDVVFRAAPWFPPILFSFISMFAVTNTALLNYVMGSRLVYGMAKHGLLPKALGRIHPKRRTPHVAIFWLMVIVLALALSGDISVLAKATSVLLLLVFMVVNAALIILKRRKDEPVGRFEIPAFVPAGGILICLAMILHAQTKELLTAGTLLGGIALLYFVARPKHLSDEDLASFEGE